MSSPMNESTCFNLFLQSSQLTVPELVNGACPGIPSLEVKRATSENQPKVPTTYTVSPNTENPISAAIEKAQEGSTIFVRTGRYEDPITINKSVKLVAQGKVVICATGGEATVSILKGEVSFTGFSIKQKKSRARGAFLVNGGSLTLNNCKVSSVASSTITVKNDSVVDIKDSVIKARGGNAVTATQQSQINCEKTCFCKCKLTALSLRSSTLGTVKQCVLFENSQTGISVTDQSQVSIDSCLLINCSIEIASTGETNIVKGTTIDKTFGSVGISLSQSTQGFLYRNNLKGCAIDLRGDTKTKLYSNKYTAGSLIASNQTTVESEDETFEGETPAAIGVHDAAQIVLKNTKMNDLSGIGIITYDSSKITATSLTIIGAGQQGIICHSGGELELQTATIQQTVEDGILIQDGNVTAKNLTIQKSKTNGFSISDSSNCSLTNCSFIDNAHCGLIVNHTTLSIDNIIVTGNGYSGVHSIGSRFKISNSTISNNRKGGVISAENSKLIVEKSQLENNGWAGLLTENGSKIKATSTSLLTNNVGVVNMGKVTLVNCKVFSHSTIALQSLGKLKVKESNLASNGSAIVAGTTSARVIVSNSTFTGNALNIEVTNGASLEMTESKLNQTSGSSALNITGQATASIKNSNITDSKNVGLFVDGRIDLEDSTIANSGKIALLCAEKSTGSIKNNTFNGNGQCGIQLGGGSCNIQSNSIQNFTQFGIYIKPESKASVENNTISNNRLANIWKE
ncbi:protein ubiquitination [Tritrichomonas musculus]|uniref:Protein ubiquitination n=1 Tax=Tritrichomonas musculus TaxID=1915356 RepID=A0ABR2KGI4_9EUKA